MHWYKRTNHLKQTFLFLSAVLFMTEVDIVFVVNQGSLCIHQRSTDACDSHFNISLIETCTNKASIMASVQSKKIVVRDTESSAKWRLWLFHAKGVNCFKRLKYPVSKKSRIPQVNDLHTYVYSVAFLWEFLCLVQRHSNVILLIKILNLIHKT